MIINQKTEQLSPVWPFSFLISLLFHIFLIFFRPFVMMRKLILILELKFYLKTSFCLYTRISSLKVQKIHSIPKISQSISKLDLIIFPSIFPLSFLIFKLFFCILQYPPIFYSILFSPILQHLV
jgi:hypothetical protein